jgi:beta-glucosidase
MTKDQLTAQFSFPTGFLWGTASSSYQVEGQNTNNDWHAEQGGILAGDVAGDACEWWAGRWKEDLDRCADAGQNAHRLSIEWSRIQPKANMWDEEALEIYRQILQGCRQRGLQPMVTLHHFTLPLWIYESGGWLSPNIPELFDQYVQRVISDLGEFVSQWVTINEPNILVTLAHVQGIFPNKGVGTRQAQEAATNMLKAHAAAYNTIHSASPNSMVGMAHHYRAFYPRDPRNPLDRWSARRRSTFNHLFPDALQTGRLRISPRSHNVEQAAGTQDFFGLNYYTVERVRFAFGQPRMQILRGDYPDHWDVSPNRHMANAPLGLWEALKWARGYKLPIIITENGVEDETDAMRPRYLAKHLHQIWRALNHNWNVRGYFHWTMVDNFEWDRGWSQRFGLHALDRANQRRIPRPSAHLYAEICKTGNLSSEMVARYCPEIFEELFPGSPPPGSY